MTNKYDYGVSSTDQNEDRQITTLPKGVLFNTFKFLNNSDVEMDTKKGCGRSTLRKTYCD